jgi:FkbM family methyltransferase
MLYLARDAFVGRQLDLYGEKGEDEQRMLDRLAGPGDVVVEAGANIGAHTVALADRVGPDGVVHAFEPQRFIYQILTANLLLNGKQRARTYHAAVGAAPGTIAVPTLDYANPNNFGGLSLDGASTANIGEASSSEDVPVVTVDSLALDRLNLLKIDVEGMEQAVLSGARETVARCRPTLYFEADRKERNPLLFATAFELGYRLWWHLAPLFDPRNFAGNRDNEFPNIVSINVIGVPRERDLYLTDNKEVTSPEQVSPFQ